MPLKASQNTHTAESWGKEGWIPALDLQCLVHIFHVMGLGQWDFPSQGRSMVQYRIATLNTRSPSATASSSFTSFLWKWFSPCEAAKSPRHPRSLCYLWRLLVTLTNVAHPARSAISPCSFAATFAPFPSSFAAAWYFSTPQKKQLVDRHSLWEILLLLMGCALLQTYHVYAHPQKMHCIIRQAIYWCAILLVAACSRSYHFPSLPEVMTNVWH